MRRALRILSVTLVTAGLVVLFDAGMTLAWKEPVSAIYSQLQQDQARSDLDELSANFRADAAIQEIVEGPAALERRAKRLANAFEDELENGEPIGRIDNDSGSFDYVVFEGTDTNTLEKGPGRYPETALPGQGETIGIAGHRTTYGAPFRKINKIEDGDRITVEMPYGTFIYSAEKSRIVEPTQTGIVRDIGRERLVLTACHPLYSAAQRYAVFARLVEIELPE
jgi:sortase A